MKKEKTVAVVLCVVFSIIINIMFTVGLIFLMVGNSVFNPSYYKKIVTNDRVVDTLYEPLCEELDRLFEDYDIDGEAEDYVDEEFFKTLMGDYTEIVFEGKRAKDVFDEDYYEDFAEELVDDLDVPADKKDEAIDAFLDGMTSAFESEDVSDTFSEIKEIRGYLLATAYVLLGICAALAVVMILLYNNKFRPLRALSISTLISSLAILGFSVLIKTAIVTELVEELKDEGEELGAEIMESLVGAVFNYPLQVAGVICAASIIGIVVFSVLSANYGKTFDEDDNSYYNEE